MEIHANYWGKFFSEWPTDVARRGIIVTAFDEQILFATFLASSNFLLLERQTPDSLGARTVIVPYDQIVALKIVDVVKSKQFKNAGFDVPTAKTSSATHLEE
jgi:hypothetical protein